MSEQRIDTAAEAATSTDADPGEGLGLASPPSPGGDAEMPQPTPDRSGGGSADRADTEGARYLQDTEANQAGPADLSGRQPAESGTSASSSGPAPSGRPGGEESGEVSAAPSRQRREQDPGSMATEFGDRADESPGTDIAHPSI